MPNSHLEMDTDETMLDYARLHQLIKRNEYWLEIARPFVRRVHKLLKQSEVTIILTDATGVIMELTGNPKSLKAAIESHIQLGCCMASHFAGPSGIKLALQQNEPVQLVSLSNPDKLLLGWDCSASPIHDIEGQLIGAIDISLRSENSSPHTLALVSALAMAIEGQILQNMATQQLENSHQFIYAITNSLAHGLFAIDLNGAVLYVNDSACRRLNIRRLTLLRMSFDELLPNWRDILKILKQGKSFLNEEVHFVSSGNRFVANAYPIHKSDTDLELIGMSISFRGLQRVLNLVNKYTGMQARFCFADILTQTPTMHELISRAKRVANSPSTVMIFGESGTGKEVLAQSIHNASARQEAGFVAVNCGAIPENLIESELFGYADGAFTGARKGGHPGKFELADNGTLFLDEIGDMPMNMQVKILRALQEGQITRIGGSEPVALDVRIIAATNKDLWAEVEKGNFRLDLFYRLNVIALRMPALRHRPMDILGLFKQFLSDKAVKLEKNIANIPVELAEKLLRYRWPGNIRELENFAEKFVLLDGKIDLNLTEHEGKSLLGQQTDFVPNTLLSMDEIEAKTILERLVAMEHNVSKVARSLGVSRNTLYVKMKKYGIPY
jgi:transcriptional regulator with PAS, ATPase and Fis domain